jgi:hypothetical protein
VKIAMRHKSLVKAVFTLCSIALGAQADMAEK